MSTSTRLVHQGNLDRHILPVLGSRTVADVTPTEIHRLLNGLEASVSVAPADGVYRTCSAPFNTAVADDVMVRSPVKSKHHRPRGCQHRRCPRQDGVTSSPVVCRECPRGTGAAGPL